MPFSHGMIPKRGAKQSGGLSSPPPPHYSSSKVKRGSQGETGMEMGRTESLSLRVIEQAKEELEMLEAQYPNRFRSLKVELQSFIFLHSQNLSLNPSNSPSSPPSSSHKTPSATSSSAATQASSNSGRKRKRNSAISEGEESEQKLRSGVDGDRVDVVLKRAHLCLQKIKDLKTSFFCR